MTELIDWSKVRTAEMKRADARKTMQRLVDEERDRRIDAGYVYKGVLFQSAQTDRENIAGAAQLAFMAIMQGAQPGDLRWSSPHSDFQWIASDNSLVSMDAQMVVDFATEVAAQKSFMIFCARQLKDMKEIPSDFTADKYWGL